MAISLARPAPPTALICGEGAPLPIGPTYTHPSAPLLGFFQHPGWTPTTIDGGIHNVGVNLIRDDNQAIWRHQLVGGFVATGFNIMFRIGNHTAIVTA